jgi:hypothetical protein
VLVSQKRVAVPGDRVAASVRYRHVNVQSIPTLRHGKVAELADIRRDCGRTTGSERWRRGCACSAVGIGRAAAAPLRRVAPRGCEGPRRRVSRYRLRKCLSSEQYDPIVRRQTGNFPQALTHLALIITASNIHNAMHPAEQPAVQRSQ